MEIAEVRQLLIRNDTRLFCVLDGATVDELPMQLYKFQVPHECLMTGDLPADVLYSAPFLAFVSGEDDFSNWVFDNAFGKNWGVFLHTRASMLDIRNHLRSLMTVYTEEGKPMVFRYYDPRVIRKFLPTCNPGELKTFFGKIDTFYAETETSSLDSFTIENDVLRVKTFE